MRTVHIVGLTATGVALSVGVVALVTRRRASLQKNPDSGHEATATSLIGTAAPAAPAPADDPVAAPAYPYLDHWSQEERRALLDLQRELGLDPRQGGLAGVIGHESAGDPSVPLARAGTPRGGLIQVTVGAHLPGYQTSDAVWAIRDQGRLAQLRGVVRDFYRRQMPHGPPMDQSASALLRRNYLPGLAGKPADFVLGVRPDGRRGEDGALLPGQRAAGAGPGGEGPGDTLAAGLTRAANYAANPGFDLAGRGWFAWEDVDRQAARAEAAALARGWVRVSGARVPPGDLPVAGATAIGDPNLSVVTLGQTVSHGDPGQLAYGFWCDASPEGERLPNPRFLVDPTWDHAERERVASALDVGREVASYKGWANCRLCGKSIGSRDLTDGVYVYPDGLSHYVREHAVQVPDDMRARALAKRVAHEACGGAGFWAPGCGCSDEKIGAAPAAVAGASSEAEAALRAAKERVRTAIGRPPWLTGGVGIGASCVIVGVLEVTDEIRRLVPESVDGVPVRLEEVGQVYAQDREPPLAGAADSEESKGALWE